MRGGWLGQAVRSSIHRRVPHSTFVWLSGDFYSSFLEINPALRALHRRDSECMPCSSTLDHHTAILAAAPAFSPPPLFASHPHVIFTTTFIPILERRWLPKDMPFRNLSTATKSVTRCLREHSLESGELSLFAYRHSLFARTIAGEKRKAKRQNATPKEQPHIHAIPNLPPHP